MKLMTILLRGINHHKNPSLLTKGKMKTIKDIFDNIRKILKKNIRIILHERKQRDFHAQWLRNCLPVQGTQV